MEIVASSKKSSECGQGLLLNNLLGAGVLGHGLGSLGNGVLGEFSGQEQTHSSLDFSARDGGASVVVGQTGSLGGDALEDVVHEGVHDGHGLGGDTSVGMNLLQHFVDVDGVRLPPPFPALLVARELGFGLAGLLFGSLGGGFGRHDAVQVRVQGQLTTNCRLAVFISHFMQIRW